MSFHCWTLRIVALIVVVTLAVDHRLRADEPQRARNPLIRAYEDLIEQSEFENDEDVDSLRNMLREADETLTRVKNENRRAIRQANRHIPTMLAAKTNIVLVLVDDLDPLSSSEELPAESPLARLKREGMTFADYHAGSSLDGDAFWSLMTGRFPANILRNENSNPLLATEQGTLLSVMWHAGYSTGYFGAWPLDGPIGPMQCDADTFVGVRGTEASAESYPAKFLINDIPQEIPNADGGRHFVWSLTTLQALAAMERESLGRPFFHVIRYHAVDVPADELEGLDAVQENRTARRMRVERELTRILEYLDRRKSVSNTLVIVAGETPAGNGEREANELVDQEALRTPLYVRWPVVVPRGAVSHQPAAAFDLLPTLATIARDERFAAQSQGKSIYSALTGRPDLRERLMYWQIPEADKGVWQVVRLGQWKAVLAPGSKDVRLYDLRDDPEETTDVSDDHPEVVGRVLRPN